MKIGHIFSAQHIHSVNDSFKKAGRAVSHFFQNVMNIKNSNVEKAQQPACEPRTIPMHHRIGRNEGEMIGARLYRIFEANDRFDRSYGAQSPQTTEQTLRHALSEDMEKGKRVSFNNWLYK
ncbi:hypothetical protein [Vagococcus sp. WN89Y]|uniref:hypothetical protein n=1 Tax=Vagococcus sp. WN89Y TaxID=3457258 RepID=UPI003FCE9AE3